MADLGYLAKLQVELIENAKKSEAFLERIKDEPDDTEVTAPAWFYRMLAEWHIDSGHLIADMVQAHRELASGIAAFGNGLDQIESALTRPYNRMSARENKKGG